MELHLVFISKRFSQERREVFDFKLTIINGGSTIVNLVPAGYLEGVELPNDTHRPQVLFYIFTAVVNGTDVFSLRT